MMEDPRVLAYREVGREVVKGLSAKPGTSDRYRDALGPYLECMAEHCEPHIRPHMMLALFNEGIPLGAIAIGFKATEEELEPIRNLPKVQPETMSEVDRLSHLPYSVYLKTDHWRAVRAEALKRAANRCALCNSPDRLEVHHRSYRTLGAETPADVIALCDRCHSRHHGKKRRAA